MNIYKNARLTPQGRLLLVERITEAGWSVVQAAQAEGISLRQSYRWLGVIAPRERQVWVIAARRPTTASAAGDRVSEIERFRRQPMSGP